MLNSQMSSLSRQTGASLQGISLCFDLDGTLVDTAPDLVRVTNEVIATRGHGPTPYPLARQNVGYGSRRMISTALARENDTVSTAELDQLQAKFLEIYADTIDQLSQPFFGVEATLKDLRRLGADLSVCTNKPGWLARPLLVKLGLSGYFTRIIGSDDARETKPIAGNAKPDPRHVFTTAGHRDRTRIVMIGDSWPDMRAGLNARAYRILMTYGYTPISALRLGADIRLTRFCDIKPALIARFAKGA